MCGIFGHFGSDAVDDDGVLQALRRRGPDGHGIERIALPAGSSARRCTLIHTRLAIIDLSRAADQPMTDEHGRYTIAFNGEIYNYRELREELQQLGHTFRTQSDTEVLLSAYMQWGEDILPRLRGMFAFAVIDRLDGSAFLARDPFGIKPLYYLDGDGEFAFASSLAALFAAGLRSGFHLDGDAIRRYLAFGAFIAPDTVVEEVHALPPGHTLRLAGGKVSIKRYYAPADPVARRDQPTDNIMAGLRETLFASVERHLVSDVPVGVFLSGGIDSSLVACMAAHIMNAPVRTFTVGFRRNHGMHDETEAAARTAKRIGAEHENVLLDDTDFADTLDDFLDAIDMPSGDGLNSYFVSRAIDGRAKVILSGIGGDEIFCGYPYFRQLRSPPPAGPLDRFLSPLPERALQRLGKPHLVHRGQSRDEMLLGLRMRGRHADFARARFRNVLNPTQSPLAAASILELSSYLPNQLLRDVDAVSMHHSLEIRVPFVDLDVVSYALSVPDRYKVLPHVNKALLVSPFFDLLPMETYWQSDKRGFELPLSAWLSEYLTTERYDSLASSAWHWGLSALGQPFDKMVDRQEMGRRLPEMSRWLILLKWLERRAPYLRPPLEATPSGRPSAHVA